MSYNGPRFHAIARDKGEWHDDASCRETDPESFYIEHGGNYASELFEMCHNCPVKVQCLAAGLTETHGLWGGATERERRRVKRGGPAAMAAHFENLAIKAARYRKELRREAS